MGSRAAAEHRLVLTGAIKGKVEALMQFPASEVATGLSCTWPRAVVTMGITILFELYCLVGLRPSLTGRPFCFSH